MPCSRHNSAAGTPPSIWRSTPMIWASVKRVFFIGISSFILPRKFYFRIPLTSGGITPSGRHGAIGYRVLRGETGKNAADILVALDALELVLSKDIRCFVIACFDGGFTQLTARLQ
ncbi:NYN domain-containing protein [Sulfitobacter sp. Ks16]|uniref:NYN domain-containing protein n=1 Tax=unclassified Sulfitobacter TaxID=196795 RepID=UPI00320B8EB6